VGELDSWKHCPVCTTPVKSEGGKVECPECGFLDYANPKPTASALVLDDEGRIMFSRRARDPAAGKFDLPGGFVEEGEHPLECLHRELREEAGISLRDTEFVGIFMDWYSVRERRVSTLNLYWSARIADGTPAPADDVTELRFFAPDEVPRDELAFEHLPDVISAWRARNENA
jgi:ADP-ribose pyrophosphatase YjhB (NUDIX family)